MHDIEHLRRRLAKFELLIIPLVVVGDPLGAHSGIVGHKRQPRGVTYDSHKYERDNRRPKVSW